MCIATTGGTSGFRHPVSVDLCSVSAEYNLKVDPTQTWKAYNWPDSAQRSPTEFTADRSQQILETFYHNFRHVAIGGLSRRRADMILDNFQVERTPSRVSFSRAYCCSMYQLVPPRYDDRGPASAPLLVLQPVPQFLVLTANVAVAL